MIRIVDGKEVVVICLNDDCHYWDNTCLYYCSKYYSTNALIECPDHSFEPWFISDVKP